MAVDIIARGMASAAKKIIEDVSVGGFEPLVVEQLPEVGKSGVLYLVERDSENEINYCDEFLWIESQSKFELIGSTGIDLTDYYTKEEVDAGLEKRALLEMVEDRFGYVNETLNEHASKFGNYPDFSYINDMRVAIYDTISQVSNRVGDCVTGEQFSQAVTGLGNGLTQTANRVTVIEEQLQGVVSLLDTINGEVI